MPTSREFSGFIAYRGHLIWGIGSTEDEAREAAKDWLSQESECLPEKELEELRKAGLSDEADSRYPLEKAVEELVIIPATKRLIELVKEEGGDIAWRWQTYADVKED